MIGETERTTDQEITNDDWVLRGDYTWTFRLFGKRVWGGKSNVKNTLVDSKKPKGVGFKNE